MDQGPIILTEHLNSNGVKQKWQYFTTATFRGTILRGNIICFENALIVSTSQTRTYMGRYVN